MSKEALSIPSHSASFPMEFQAWLDTWGPKLWEVLVYFHSDSSEVTEEFKEALRATFYRNQIKKRKPNDLGLSRSFVRTWSKYVERRSREDLKEWRNATLLLSLFRQGLHPTELAFILDKSPSHILMRAYELLSSDIDWEKAKALESNCVRADLHFVESHLSMTWKDPLKLFGPQHFKDHLDKCARCQGLRRHFEERAQSLKAWVPPLYPSKLFEDLEIREKTASGWFAKSLFTRWPWFIKVPVQVSLAALVVLLVLAVPFGGDLLPKKKALSPTNPVSQNLASHESEAPAMETPNSENTPPPPVVAVSNEEEGGSAPPVAKTSPPAPKPEASVVAPVKVPSVAKVPAPTAADPKLERRFWRWGAFTSHLEGDKNRILEVLKKFNAAQAGEIALGGNSQGGKYFHFSVRAEDFEKIQSEMDSLKLDNFTREQSVSSRRTPLDLRRVVFLLKAKKGGSASKEADSLSPANEAPPSAQGSP